MPFFASYYSEHIIVCRCISVVIASVAKQSHEIATSLTLLAMTLLILKANYFMLLLKSGIYFWLLIRARSF